MPYLPSKYSTFQKQKLAVLLQGQLVDHMEVLPEPEEDSDSEEDVSNPESAADSTMGPGAQLLPQELLKGYTYTPFEPMDVPRLCTSPTIKEALAALTDLRPILWPKRQTGSGYKDPSLHVKDAR